MSRKGLYAVSTVVYVVIVLFITLPPITLALDRVRPRILGLPFMQFWLLAVPVLLSIWLVIWFVWECKIEDRDAAADAIDAADTARKEGGERHE
ncbi:MAG: hypothetical protein LBS24_04965 [Clostridiales Family XIII bacterium]|jgi:hypothetical protein|nr:hypothetical protein [Clostridiales Family XIII bacterium]